MNLVSRVNEYRSQLDTRSYILLGESMAFLASGSKHMKNEWHTFCDIA